MDQIAQMLKSYHNDSALTAPCISRKVAAFLDAGVVSAEQTNFHRACPYFGYGSDTTYRVKNAAGKQMTLTLWGNTDGWGIEEE